MAESSRIRPRTVLAFVALAMAVCGVAYATIPGSAHATHRAFAPSTTNTTAIQGPAGPRGFAGADGAVGPAGATGDQGQRGSRGRHGEQGARGPRGFTGGMGPAGPAGLQGPRGVPGPAGPAGPAGAQMIAGWAFVHDGQGDNAVMQAGDGFTRVVRSASDPSIYCLTPSAGTLAAMGNSNGNSAAYGVIASPVASSNAGADPSMKALLYNTRGDSSPCAGSDDIAIETFSGNNPSTGIDFTVALLVPRS
jgi:hypothetical protein